MTTDNTNKTNNTFEYLGLPQNILKACNKMSFTTATQIQEQAIPILLSGRDVTGIAQTGTGKTAAFGLPLLTKIGNDSRKGADDRLAGLVLCPTRELAIQTANALGTYAANASMHDFNIVAIYGGTGYREQRREVERGVDVIVATPGRLIDMIDRKAVDLSHIQMTVLDEADEILKMGFLEDIENILGKITNPHVQTCLFSATMPSAVEKLSHKFQKDAAKIHAQTVASTSQNIEQKYAVVPFAKKTEATRRFIVNAHAKAAVVFVRTRATATSVAEELTAAGITAVTISGDVPQAERERIVEGMRKGRIKVLVATDVAARGLDIATIELVINYDLPRETDAYVHRIGRTGRANRQGLAISLVTPRENGKLRAIEKLIGKKIGAVEVPTLAQIASRGAKTLLHTAQDRIEKGNLEKYFTPVEKALVEQRSDIELIEYVAAIVALALHDKGEDNGDEEHFRDEFTGETSRKSSGKSRKGGERSGSYKSGANRRDDNYKGKKWDSNSKNGSRRSDGRKFEKSTDGKRSNSNAGELDAKKSRNNRVNKLKPRAEKRGTNSKAGKRGKKQGKGR